MDGALCRKFGSVLGVVGFSLTIRRWLIATTPCVRGEDESDATIGPLQSRYSECQTARLF